MDFMKPKPDAGWRHERQEATLSDVYRSVDTAKS